MKKIIDDEMMQMRENGIPVTAIANRFNTSVQAVYKRLRQLKSYEEPESFSRLTDKQKRFVLCKAEGKNSTEAAMTAFDCKDRTVGKAMAHKTLKDPDVAVAVHDLLYQSGIGRRKRIQRLRDVLQCKDLSIVCKGLEIANKLSGEYSGDKTSVSIDIDAVIQRANFLLTEIGKHEERKSEEVTEIKNGK